MLDLMLRSTVLVQQRYSSVLVFLAKLKIFVMKLLVKWLTQFKIGFVDIWDVRHTRSSRNSVLLL